MVKEGSVVYVRYLDHVLFRNTNSASLKPAVRETVGWLIKESTDAVWLLWDRSMRKLPHEESQPYESGLIILKSDILELKELKPVDS